MTREHDDDQEERPRPAVAAADAGADRWRDAARHQLRAHPDHADFYALAGTTVATLHALDDLFRVLGEQVAGYAQGRAVYDDTRRVDPTDRLAEAAAHTRAVRAALAAAAEAANGFWSAIGHVGVEDPSMSPASDTPTTAPPDTAPADTAATDAGPADTAAAGEPRVVLLCRGCGLGWEPDAPEWTGEHLHALAHGCPDCGDPLHLGHLTTPNPAPADSATPRTTR